METPVRRTSLAAANGWGVSLFVLLGCSSSPSADGGSPEVPGFAGDVTGAPASPANDAPPSPSAPVDPTSGEGAGAAPAGAAVAGADPMQSNTDSDEAMGALPLDEPDEAAPSEAPNAGANDPANAGRNPPDEPPVNEPPVNEPPVNEPPVNEPPVNEPPVNEPPVTPTLERVLVFSRTAGFRHADSIGPGIQLVNSLGQQNGFAVDATEDPAQFNAQNLARYDVVVWMSTTGDVLNAAQEQAFEQFIRSGGGWVGVHSASDTEYGWAWYGQLLGGNAYFRQHPEIQTAQVDVEIATHPSTAHLPARFAIQDELYNFRQNPRASVSVLMTLDESSYFPRDGAMVDHPIAWFHEFDGGRAWYTALGHRVELYTDPVFTRHVLGGIRWAAGIAN